jgi:hypothetical protein
MRTVHLDEIGGRRWKPIRAAFGIRAFGVNAFAADPGEALFPEHDETEPGAGDQRHQELYLVLAGRATFTCGGVSVDAPAGTRFESACASRRPLYERSVP